MFKEAEELDLLLKAAAKEPDDSEEDEDAEKEYMKGDEDEDEEDEDSGYDEKYLKKHMKRYMKGHKSEMKKNMKDLGLFTKAMSDMADSAQRDINDHQAEATLIDGTEMFKAFADVTEKMGKIMSKQAHDLAEIKSVLVEQSVIARASGATLVKAAEMLDRDLSAPNPRKGMLFGTEKPDTGMMKAQNPSYSIGTVRQALFKAAKSGDQSAMKVMTEVESCFGNFSLIPPRSMQYIDSIMGTTGGK